MATTTSTLLVHLRCLKVESLERQGDGELSGLLVNEGWSGQRKKLTWMCSQLRSDGHLSVQDDPLDTTESRVEVLSSHSSQPLARSQPLGRCSSLWLRAGPRKDFVPAASAAVIRSCRGVGPDEVIWAELHVPPHKDLSMA